MKEQLLKLFDDCITSSQEMRNGIIKRKLGLVESEGRAITRRWGINEAPSLVGVSKTAIIKAEQAGRLAQADRDAKGRRLGYTIEQIDTMRSVFGTHPWRPESSEAVTLAVVSNKGGAGKTTVAVHFAQWAAMHGYRVLLIDVDPQGTAGHYFGVHPGNLTEQDTVLPFMFGQKDSLDYAIRPTYWPRLDIIPGCQALQRIDRELDQQTGIKYPHHLMLRAGIATVSDNYDLVLIDGAPNLADGTIAQIFAADAMIIPSPAELHDTDSTEQLFSLLRGAAAAVPESQLWCIPDVRVLISKVSSSPGSSSQEVARDIRQAWGSKVLVNTLKNTEEVGKAQLRLRTVFEQDRGQRSSRASWNNAMAIWQGLFTEIMETLVNPKWGN